MSLLHSSAVTAKWAPADKMTEARMNNCLVQNQATGSIPCALLSLPPTIDSTWGGRRGKEEKTLVHVYQQDAENGRMFIDMKGETEP